MNRGRVPGGVHAFSPTSLSNLAFWVRADLGITLNGSTVSQWADQSGNGHHLVQSTGTKQPTYNATDANFAGKPSLTFDGSSDALSTTDTIALTTFEHFWVQKTTAGNRLYVMTTATPFDHAYWYNPGTPAIFLRDESTLKREFANTLTGYTAHAAGARILGYRWNGAGTQAAAENGADFSLAGVTNETPPSTSHSVTLHCFAYRGTSEYITGQLAEWILYSRTLTAGERSQVLSYLGARYNITVA